MLLEEQQQMVHIFGLLYPMGKTLNVAQPQPWLSCPFPVVNQWISFPMFLLLSVGLSFKSFSLPCSRHIHRSPSRLASNSYWS